MDENEALLKGFIDEAREHLTTIEADLLVIEEGGADIDEDLVNKVFRAAHSIKGGSGFFGLQKVKELAHKAETVLDMLRSRKMPPNAEVTNVLLAAFDQLREMINHTEASEQAEIGELLASLTGLASSYMHDAQVQLPKTPSVVLPRHSAVLPEQMERARKKQHFMYQLDFDLILDVENKGKKRADFFTSIATACEIIEKVNPTALMGTIEDFTGNSLPIRLVIATVLEPDFIDGLFETLAPEQIQLLFDPRAGSLKSVSEPQREDAAKPSTGPATENISVSTTKEIDRNPHSNKSLVAAISEETLRVDVGLLETLMNLAGELVLGRNQLRAAVSQNNGPLLVSADQRINQVTSELQDVIMQTRLQPISNVFAKFPRVVRDLSRSLGKEIELEILGKEVALDKTLIEGLSDPLTHMVRNAVDHGIETIHERVKAGKKAAGSIRIEALHEAGQVILEIADDGKGIDPDRIGNAALNKGLITAEKLAGMSASDKQGLVFLPGLSTAKVVSDVSGRGVGMDVVKTNLDRLGGMVEIHSEIGKGSTFRIKLPLTLAIIPSLIISVEEERFAIPQISIEELLRLRPEEIKSRIEIVGDREVLLLRDRILPLARLADIVGILPTYAVSEKTIREIDRRVLVADRRSPRHPVVSASEPSDQAHSQANPPTFTRTRGDRRQAATSALEIVVVNASGMSYGLVVGAFHETEEVVVKPLGRRLKHLREYSGATILGDGTVALILDTSGIAAKSGITSVAASTRALQLAAEAEAQRLQDVHCLLLFHNGPNEPFALPLDLVQRIEHIKPEQVEQLGNHRSMQYRGHSLPLVTLADSANVCTLEQESDLVVLVSSVNGHEVGLLAAMPVDVVETQAVIDQTTHRQKGIAGSTILNGRTTLIADLYELVETMHPEWGADKAQMRSETRKPGSVSVLLAEDSDFFRGQVKKYLEEDGYKVLDAPDGEAAWELLLKNLNQISIVVTDIEMPRLTGLGLAARIRADVRTAKLPIIAVTSLAGEEDEARGKAAGITEYQAKLDRDQLLTSVHNFAGQK